MKSAGNQDSAGDIIAMIVILLVSFILAIYLYEEHKGQVNQVFLTVNQSLLWLFTFLSKEAHYVYEGVGQRKAEDFTWGNITALYHFTGQYLRWVFAPLLAALALLAYRTSASNRYSNFHDVNSLLNNNVKEFPCIAPVMNRNLLDEPMHQGSWRWADKPIYWIIKHQCLLDENNQPIPLDQALDVTTTMPLDRALYDIDQAHIDKNKTNALLTHQLGPEFEGFAKLPDYQKGLCAAFMAFCNNQTEEGQAMLDQLSLSFEEDPNPPENGEYGGDNIQIDSRGAGTMIRQYIHHQYVKNSLNMHCSWTYPLIAGLLQMGRKRGGKIAPSQFLWLRPTNRPLWYALNSLGGDGTVHIEGAGILSHHLAETMLGNTIDTPEVSQCHDWIYTCLIRDEWLSRPSQKTTFNDINTENP